MSWQWKYGILMFFVSLVNYGISLMLENSTSQLRKKLWLTLAIILSMGVLVYFKYANFFIHEISALISSTGAEISIPVLNVILPVGISFFTFQSLSYTIDVYNYQMKAERNPVDFLLFVSFFPQLVAGPIERATNLLDQFKDKKYFSSDRLVEGSKMIIWGLFKKVVIADRLSVYVQQIYSDPQSFNGPSLFLATFFFAFQIYCDFSGYSDIAIGSAHILGFRLMQNFNLPYLASSIKDFWHRWHISLSTWFGDYVYKPLGGNRVGKFIWMRNILIVYLVSGLWHGASWTFIAWGGIFGILYLLENGISNLFKRFNNTTFKESGLFYIIRIIAVFISVMVAWVFFRAENINDAGYIVSHMFTGLSSMPYLGSSAFDTLTGLGLILILIIIQIFQYKGIFSIYMRTSKVNISLRLVGYATILILIALLGISSSQFIYFQF
jgi:D-alanyl-lipoteichoic acid acyltransferase DltB (MBOAT superfamily)